MTAADRYAQLRERARIHDRALFVTARLPNELELQARWFAGDFGRSFRSVCGKDIEIVQFGTWNREAGPDFHSAAIRVDGSEAIGGSIEFDMIDRNWDTHGHAINPAFDETVLHVFTQTSEPTFFTRTVTHRNVLQVRVDPATLPDAFSSNVPLARPGRCHAPLQDLPEERVLSVLDAAARFRMQRKAARLRAMTEAHGADEALFQELAAALGYKQNKLPFTLLAQRFPLAAIHEERADAEAIFFGLAGFLQEADLSSYGEDTRNYVRGLWDRWWPHRDRLQRLILPRSLWKLGGARPMNHPQRRLAAIVAIAGRWSKFYQSLGTNDAAGSIREYLLDLTHAYWSRHYTLTSECTPRAMALIGETRIAEILANVVYPFLAARGNDIWPAYEKLPARLTNRRLETGATRLFGHDPRRPAFLKTVAHQQGLLQIYEDFCLQDNSDCAHCPFPEQMQKWT